jgi:hypothetical protein
MNSETELQIRRMAIGALAVAPVCVLICFSYALRARLELGHWPTYGNPDPKTLGWSVHHQLVFLSMFLVAPALVISGLSGIWLIFRGNPRSGARFAIFSVLIWTGMVWLGHCPVGDEFCAWFFD